MVVATVTKILVMNRCRIGTYVTEGGASGRVDLGMVGEPLTPYMDADPRLDLDLAELPRLRCTLVHVDQPKDADGLRPAERIPYTDLGASDADALLGLDVQTGEQAIAWARRTADERNAA